MWNKISHFNLTAVAILLQCQHIRVSFQPIFAEILHGTETKAAAATLVHTSIQTFSHLASATLEGCPERHFSVFGWNSKLL